MINTQDQILEQDIKTILTSLRSYGYKHWENGKGIKLTNEELAVKYTGWIYRKNSSMIQSNEKLPAAVTSFSLSFQKPDGSNDEQFDTFASQINPSFSALCKTITNTSDGVLFVEVIQNFFGSFKIIYEKKENAWYSISCFDARLAAEEEAVNWRPAGFARKFIAFMNAEYTNENIQIAEQVLSRYISTQMSPGLNIRSPHVFQSNAGNWPKVPDFFQTSESMKPSTAQPQESSNYWNPGVDPNAREPYHKK